MTEQNKTDTRVTKGQRTRDRLVAEGLRLFAVKGFEAVGIRELAAAAGTNIASIAFHFGGKEGLYGAVIKQVAGELSRLHRAAFSAAAAESDAAGEGPVERSRRVMAKLIVSLLTSNRSQWMSLLLQREFIMPTASFEALYEEAIRPTLEGISRLVGAANERDGQSMDDRIIAYSLFTVTGAFSRNKNFLRFAGKTEYAEQDIETISRVVSEFVENGLRPRP